MVVREKARAFLYSKKCPAFGQIEHDRESWLPVDGEIFHQMQQVHRRQTNSRFLDRKKSEPGEERTKG
jgi:hypothetical protein